MVTVVVEKPALLIFLFNQAHVDFPAVDISPGEVFTLTEERRIA